MDSGGVKNLKAHVHMSSLTLQFMSGYKANTLENSEAQSLLGKFLERQGLESEELEFLQRHTVLLINTSQLIYIAVVWSCQRRMAAKIVTQSCTVEMVI